MKNEAQKKGTATKELVKAEIKQEIGAVREIVFREGAAAEIIPKIKRKDVVLSGTIESPAEFYGKRKEQFTHDRANIQFSKDPAKLSIVLMTNEHMERPHYQITGKLEMSEDLILFGIAYKSSSTPKTYTTKDLAKLLRFNKRLFAQADECNSTIESLLKVKIKVDAEIKSEDSTRGDKANSYSQTVSTGIAIKFNFSMQLFKGKEPKNFQVDVCLDVKEREVFMWLESPELATLIKADADKYINEELAKMADLVQIEN